MGEAGERVILASSGRKNGADLRVDVRLLAHKDGRTRIVVDWFEGIRYTDSETVWEAATLADAIGLGTAFNDAVARLKRDGFRGLKPFPAVYAYEIAEAVAYVKLTGEQPRLGEDFHLQLSALDAEALASPVGVNAEREEPADERRSALLESLARRSFPELEGDGLEELTKPGHPRADS